MKFGRCFAWVLLVGFCLSWHGRLEPDFASSHSSLSFHVADHDDDSNDVPTATEGDHKDQHGCYHSHAPFVAVKAVLDRRLASIQLVAPIVKTPDSVDLTNILHPPRA
jgi:ABC-type nickel/cobalt efflux system permease component RcnA